MSTKVNVKVTVEPGKVEKTTKVETRWPDAPKPPTDDLPTGHRRQPYA